MIMNGAILAFCALYKLAMCDPDHIANAVIEHLGAPYDQITWCCGTAFSRGESPKHWELEKPHTRLCSGDDIDGRNPVWKDGIGAIKMSGASGDYCAIWLHRGAAPVS